MGEFSVLGPIDPQILGLPAASIVRARDAKPVADVFDLTLVLADVSEKAVAQVKRGAVELLTPRLDQSAAETIAEKLTGGYWTHDYALTATEAKALGLPVKVGMPVHEALPSTNSTIGDRVSPHRSCASEKSLK